MKICTRSNEVADSEKFVGEICSECYDKEKHCCKICGKRVEQSSNGLRRYCSEKCRHIANNEIAKNTARKKQDAWRNQTDIGQLKSMIKTTDKINKEIDYFESKFGIIAETKVHKHFIDNKIEKTEIYFKEIKDLKKKLEENLNLDEKTRINNRIYKLYSLLSRYRY